MALVWGGGNQCHHVHRGDLKAVLQTFRHRHHFRSASADHFITQIEQGLHQHLQRALHPREGKATRLSSTENTKLRNAH
ncbi:hypothetical protein D3C76_255680 [compost metagenome]|jgi:hypothetical protein